MRYEEAFALIEEEFDEHGYSKKMIASKSRFQHVLKSKYGPLACTGDWPIGFYPNKDDLEATDWNLVNSTSEYE